MKDSEIKRQVLGKLMDLMDEHTRDGMKDSFLSDDGQDETELDQHSSTPLENILKGEKKKDEEEDPNEPRSIDPIVMLAKRFSK